MSAKKQVTKQMILSAALNMLKAGGMEAVTVKALARKLNCSTQPIYLSFDKMEELRSELSSLAVSEFLKEIGRDYEAVNLYGMSYIQFSKDEKYLFQFLFMRQNAFEELHEVLSPIINSSIARLSSHYGISPEEAHHFHDQLWMHTHGIASMIATGFCEWNMDKVEQMILECEKYLGQKYGGLNVFQ